MSISTLILLLLITVLYISGFVFSLYFQHPMAYLDENDQPQVAMEPSKSTVMKSAVVWFILPLKILIEDAPEILSELYDWVRNK